MTTAVEIPLDNEAFALPSYAVDTRLVLGWTLDKSGSGSMPDLLVNWNGHPVGWQEKHTFIR